MAVMTVVYLRHRSELKEEGERRSDAVEGEGDADVDDLASDSNLDDDDFREALQDEIDAGEEDNSKRSLNDLL